MRTFLSYSGSVLEMLCQVKNSNIHAGDFMCFTAFHRRRDVCDAEDFKCLAGERGNHVQVGRWRTPSPLNNAAGGGPETIA